MKAWGLIFGIALFGAIGTLSRYGLSQAAVWVCGPGYPWGTFVVNLSGCFLFGTLVGLFKTGTLPSSWETILLTGLLGGFTTFSAFAYENVVLLQQGRFVAFSLHCAGQTVLGLFAVLLGLVAVCRP